MAMISIGQAIMQATRPKVLMAPLQIGLAVQLHSHFASQYIVDRLHAHGFCSSYHHVQTFEKCAACKQGVDLPVERNHFLQFVADNVDHNVRTIDGHGTFHGMGMIATITSCSILPLSIDTHLKKANSEICYFFFLLLLFVQ